MPVGSESARKGVLKRLEKQLGDVFFKTANEDEFNKKTIEERINILIEFKNNHPDLFPRQKRKKSTKLETETTKERSLNDITKALNKTLKEIDLMLENNEYNDTEYNQVIESLNLIQKDICETIQKAKDKNIEIAEKHFAYWKNKIESLKK